MPTGSAPQLSIIQAPVRDGVRSFLPASCSKPVTSSVAECSTLPSWLCRKMTWTSAKSSASQSIEAFIASVVASAEPRCTDGSSKTSVRGKTPGVYPSTVQTMSAAPSRTWL